MSEYALTTKHPDSIKELVETNRQNGFQDLSDKKKAFAIFYVTEGYSIERSAKEVDVCLMTGYKYKRDPLTAAYINDLMDKYLAESVVNKQTLDSYLDNLEDLALGRVDTHDMTADGDQKQGKVFHPALALKIYQERARLHEVVKDDSKGSGSVSVTINMGGMLPVEVVNE